MRRNARALVSISLLVVLAGYGVALHAILFPFSTFSLSLLSDIINLPYFQIYGYLELDTILEAATNNTISPNLDPPSYRNYFGLFLAGLFLLFTNVLLLNLLIAMFNTSYKRVESDSAFHNVINQIDFLREYEQRSVFPPPFVIIDYLLIAPAQWCYRKYQKRPVGDNFDDTYIPYALVYVHKNFILREIEGYFLEQKEADSGSVSGQLKELTRQTHEQFKQTMKRVEDQGKDVRQTGEQITQVMKRVEEQGKDVRQTMKRVEEQGKDVRHLSRQIQDLTDILLAKGGEQKKKNLCDVSSRESD